MSDCALKLRLPFTLSGGKGAVGNRPPVAAAHSSVTTISRDVQFGFLIRQAFCNPFLFVDIFDHTNEIIGFAVQIAHQRIVNARPENTAIPAAITTFHDVGIALALDQFIEELVIYLPVFRNRRGACIDTP